MVVQDILSDLEQMEVASKYGDAAEPDPCYPVIYL